MPFLPGRPLWMAPWCISLFMWYSIGWLNVYWYFKRSKRKWIEAFPTLTEFFSRVNKDQLKSTDIARFEMSLINEQNARLNNSFKMWYKNSLTISDPYFLMEINEHNGDGKCASAIWYKIMLRVQTKMSKNLSH